MKRIYQSLMQDSNRQIPTCESGIRGSTVSTGALGTAP